MMFRLEIETAPPDEIAEILHQLAKQINDNGLTGLTGGNLRDDNGDTVGGWQYHAGDGDLVYDLLNRDDVEPLRRFKVQTSGEFAATREFTEHNNYTDASLWFDQVLEERRGDGWTIEETIATYRKAHCTSTVDSNVTVRRSIVVEILDLATPVTLTDQP